MAGLRCRGTHAQASRLRAVPPPPLHSAHPAPMSRIERNRGPRQKPRRFQLLLVLSMFCSERRQPAKKLIADRNNYSEEGAAKFSVGFLVVGAQRGLFLLHPQHGKHALMLSQVPMFDSAIRFFLRNRNTGCPAAAKSKSKNHPSPSPHATAPKPAASRLPPGTTADTPSQAASLTVGNSAAQPAPRCPKPVDTCRVQPITYP
jgi:hypothetical protein